MLFVFYGHELLRVCLKAPALTGYVGDTQLLTATSNRQRVGFGHLRTPSVEGVALHTWAAAEGGGGQNVSREFGGGGKRTAVCSPKPLLESTLLEIGVGLVGASFS